MEDKFDLLIEFIAYYPHAVQKNKNASPGIESLWKDKKFQDEGAEKDAAAIRKKIAMRNKEMSETRQATGIINYLWTKFETKFGNSTKKSWRFLDVNANGQIDLQEFKAGLEKL